MNGGYLDTDPQSASAQAGDLRRAQEDWLAALGGSAPPIPIGVFGPGLYAQAARLAAARTRVHEVRRARARQLAEAADSAGSLIRTIAAADLESGTALTSSTKGGAS